MLTITETFSPGVAAENETWHTAAAAQARLTTAKTPREFCGLFSVAPVHYAPIIADMPPSTILDVGVGAGQSSVFLASKGHKVFVVEPGPGPCGSIEAASNKFGLDITVCNGVGEDIDKVPAQFDAVFFNSSLHHCDDPLLALKHSYAKLKPGGRIYLVNENYLRPWVSEARFQELLTLYPEKMGHYGGNEHSYHNWTYLRMLSAAGFSDVQTLVPSTGGALTRLKALMEQNRFRSGGPVLARLAFYTLEDAITENRALHGLLSRLSLVGCHFTGAK